VNYLWKEWRDHRVVLLGVAALLPVVVFGGLLLIDEAVSPVAGAAAGLLAAALALASDLVPGEARRGTLLFLRRLPSGIGPAFRAKALVLLAAIVLFAALGYGAAALAQRVADHPVAGPDWTYAPEALAVVLWVFAVSMWLPRGELSLPATALCLGAFLLPLHLLLEWNPGLKLPSMDLGRWALAPAALVVAWLSFRGRRFGGAWGSAWRGLLVTLVLFTPAWAYVGREVAEWRRFDVKECEFLEVYPGAGGRYLFVNARCGGPMRAVLIDTKTGDWRTVGAPRDVFWPVRGVGSFPVVALDEEATRDKEGVWQHYYDGATGEEFKSGWSHMRHDEVERRVARPAPDDGSRIEIRDRRAIVRVRGDATERLFPR
jgi:hypothetical protein